MSIGAIGGAGGFVPPMPAARPSLADPPGGGKDLAGGAGGLTGPAGTGFADQVTSALESVNESQQVADGMAQQASTGTLSDIHDYMIASTQAQLATELTVAVRNRALESFQSVMNMQV